MKLIINVDLLESEKISLKEFALLLYYRAVGRCNFDEETSEDLWNKGYLCKQIDGYSLVPMSFRRVMSVASSEKLPSEERLTKLALKLMELVPQGRMFNGPYYYKCNKTENMRALRKFYEMYNGKQYTDKDIIDATKEWVDSFNEEYEHMIQLKNFICRLDFRTGEISSLLASYLEDKYDEKDSLRYTY